MTEVLLPCPFCGGTNVKPFGPYGWYRQWGISHSCKSFYSGTSEMFQGFHSEADAIAAWNTRQPLTGQAYLVWSNEHGAWWGKDHCGYTRIIANAGRYSRAEALAIAGTRDGGWYVGKGNPDEIAMPEQDALDQYVSITRAQEAALAPLSQSKGEGL